MKRSLLFVFLLGLGFQARADVNSVDRSKRNFRLDPTSGVVYADLVVAYQDPPASANLGGLTTSAFLTQAFRNASLELFTASKGAVQLGRVTVIPAAFASNGSVKSDPDVVLLADPSTTQCPSGLLRPEDVPSGSTLVCADAHTGGYLGLAWWMPTTTLQGGNDPVFARTVGGVGVTSQGARIAIGWNTLAAYGAKVLVHEFGHYLFAMRDEYYGPLFGDVETFESARAQDPVLFSGVALAGGNTSLPPLKQQFKGYGMGLLSEYVPTQGYSAKILPKAGAGAAEWAAFPGEMFEQWAVTQQIASVATRSPTGTTVRFGGMWSLETAIRTGLNATSATPVAYAPVVLPPSAHNSATGAQVDVFGAGQANIFVFDRSASMMTLVSGENPASVKKWDAAVDFFGRLTHQDATANSPTYPTTAHFGFVDFNETLEEQVVYPASIDALKPFTIPYLPATGAMDKKLAWTSALSPAMPLPAGNTNLVGALGLAQSRLDNDAQRPFQRNVILISDGLHNYPDPFAFSGDEGLDGKYRVFTITVDTKLDDNRFGTKMQNLAKRSVGPEGVNGLAFFTNGDNTTGQLTQAANDVFNAINQMDLNTVAPSILYRDAAFATNTDPGQKKAQFSMSWSGSVSPILSLSLPNGQTFPEGNANGISFRSGKNFKSFDVDLTKFPLVVGKTVNTWVLRAQSNAYLPITIFPSVATRSSQLQVNVGFDPRFVRASGRLPVTVVVQDGRPIEGLQVFAILTNRQTGVVRNIPLSWNGSAYVGALAGNLQPGLGDLAISVVHPNNGKVFFARGENRLPDAQCTPYPYFAARQQSQQIWIEGAAVAKTIAGLEAWTLNSQPANAQGTTMKLFLKNGTSVPLTGLKARYFYSVSEFPNGIPSVSVNYLPQSKVTVGAVTGRPGLAYVQYDFGPLTLQPGGSSSNGTNGGEDLTLIESKWNTPWNTTNDWSVQGLNTTWAANRFVNIYDATGKLIVGNPDLEPIGRVDDAQPIVSLVSPYLVVVGSPASFVANAVDPEREPLAYTWTVDGIQTTPNPGAPSQLVFTFATAGTHTVSVKVDDGHSAFVTATSLVVVQPAVGACTDANTRDLGAASQNLTLGLSTGINCFVVKSSALSSEWKWSNVVFQANSVNGLALTGLSVQAVPTGSSTTLGGYSQTVAYPNPAAASLYLKVQATSARPVMLNWWLQ